MGPVDPRAPHAHYRFHQPDLLVHDLILRVLEHAAHVHLVGADGKLPPARPHFLRVLAPAPDGGGTGPRLGSTWLEGGEHMARGG